MDLGTRERANPTGVLEEMKRLAVEQLGGVPSALYAPVAEALDDAARRAGLIQIRRGDHIALLNLRQRNAGYVMRYRQLIAQGFEDFRALPNRSRNGQPLGLVEDRHLGFHYAGQKLAESIGQRYVRQLEMLDQRLETLARDLGANSSSNPIGATRLAGAFLATFHDADLPETLRPLLFRQYEHELSRVLGDLYGRINTLLAAAGYGLSQTASPAAQAADGATVAPAAAHARPESPDVDAMERFGELRAMLHAWRDGSSESAPAGAAATGGPRRELRSAEVISVTSLLQRDGIEPYARALAGAGSLADAIRNQLSEGARRLGLDPDQTRIGAHENDAIDLVGLLFESLFQTHAMLDRARRVYARLVLPYVKVALSDDGLFLRRDHPARRLFDTITEACEGNDGATPQDRELLERAAGIAQRIVADYNEDIEIFALASAELEALLDQQRKRVDLLEKRAAEAVHGKERLLQARLQAGAALNQRLRTPLTEAVAEFLVEHWQHHLLQTLLREGRESPKHADVLALADALIVVDTLAAQARGGVVADRLIALQPAIVECLVACGHDEHGANDWLAGVVRALAQPDLPRMVRNLPPPVVADDDSEQGALRVVGGHAGLDFDPDVAQRMRLLAPGEWLRLLDQQGEHVAAKVAWTSPLSGRFLLVNRRGARVLVASAEQLAALVAEGRLVAGTEQAPFDEAMRQMRARLNRAVGQN
ncbi:Thymidine phosphorylase [Lysobacter dokdonensis DS-58]|uniref:Thymidine phosphorylase n=2 Tax=Noviluteimonas TaxID=3382693 RepID=A0A0A2X2V1_9GAMM|nr:Thymidine phosphorylase [Lysobacter dokdonensis DS-58]